MENMQHPDGINEIKKIFFRVITKTVKLNNG